VLKDLKCFSEIKCFSVRQNMVPLYTPACKMSTSVNT
jgi:hypothetical protein